RALAGGRLVGWRGDLRRPEHRRYDPQGAQETWRARSRSHLSGTDDEAQPVDADRRALQGDARAARAEPRRQGDTTAVPRDARPNGNSADALQPVPARVLRRHAAADHDRA